MGNPTVDGPCSGMSDSRWCWAHGHRWLRRPPYPQDPSVSSQDRKPLLNAEAGGGGREAPSGCPGCSSAEFLGPGRPAVYSEQHSRPAPGTRPSTEQVLSAQVYAKEVQAQSSVAIPGSWGGHGDGGVAWAHCGSSGDARVQRELRTPGVPRARAVPLGDKDVCGLLFTPCPGTPTQDAEGSPLGSHSGAQGRW